MKKAIITVTTLVTLLAGSSAAFASPLEPPDWLENTTPVVVVQ